MKILTVEDDKFLQKRMISLLENHGEVTACSSKEEALDAIELEGDFDVAFFDLHLSDELIHPEGIDLIAPAKKKKMQVIVLTSVDTRERKIEAYQQGADQYFLKDKFLMNPIPILETIFESTQVEEIESFFEIQYICTDREFRNRIQSLCRSLKVSKQACLLTGETGVGKSMIAKLLHEMTHPADAPFVSVNISQIPGHLIESELFGTDTGAFTDAEKKVGLLQKANGGTLFLDEIDGLKKDVQVKIQVALEEGQFYSIGGREPIKCKFQLISATCQDVYELVQKDKMRKDFFYRIRGQELTIESLRNRTRDLAPLIKKFTADFSTEIVFDNDAMNFLKSYPWPGNIRELQNLIKRLYGEKKFFVSRNDLEQLMDKEESGPKIPKSFFKFVDKHGLNPLVDYIEKAMLKQELQRQGNLTNAAKSLNIGNRKAKRIFENLTKQTL